MTATILPFPDRSAALAAAAGNHQDARRRQDAVRAGFAPTGFGDSSGDERWAAKAHHVIDHIESMLDDEPTREVIELCQHAIECLCGAAPDIDDTAAVVELVDRLRDLHVRACQANRPDPVALADFVFWLAWGDALGVRDHMIDPYVPLLGEQGHAQIRRLIADRQRDAAHQPGLFRRMTELRLRPIEAALSRSRHPSAV